MTHSISDITHTLAEINEFFGKLAQGGTPVCQAQGEVGRVANVP